MTKTHKNREVVIVSSHEFFNAAVLAERLSTLGINRGVFLTGQEDLANHWLEAGSLAKIELAPAPHQDMPSPWFVQA
mgnify:CR=1 FL=1